MTYYRPKSEPKPAFYSDEKPSKPDKKDRPSGKKFMKGLSDKRASEMETYNKEAKEFVKGKKCAVFPDKDATECHHTKGRTGKLLLDQKWWLAVSRAGHNWINDNPNAAMEKGFTFSRLSK